MRVFLTVDARGRKRSGSPARAAINFEAILRAAGAAGGFDPDSVEVFAERGDAPQRVAHRVERLWGSSAAGLVFAVPDETCGRFTVYFDAAGERRKKPLRYPGLVGDGDLFREELARREIAASHFDQFADLDGDGDLDLLQGGVEPFIRCFENTGGNRFAERGRLASRGEALKLPSSPEGRSWVTAAFFDLDGDGDQDFFPSLNDGPDVGRILFYRNSTPAGSRDFAFDRVGPLTTESGAPLAGGDQAGGWFPSIAFFRSAGGAGSTPAGALVGSGNRCWLYRWLGSGADGRPRFAEAIPLRAGGREIELVNPRFDAADIDADGDLDLFAGTQPGPVLCFRNQSGSGEFQLAAGEVVAFDGRYLIGDAHSGVKAADFDGDGLIDLAAGRFWERADLNRPDAPREFGGYWKNIGAPAAPRFERSREGAPWTEAYQICDAIRQNSLRAVDWDEDGRADLLAGDTDGFIWFFKNLGAGRSPLFAAGVRLRAGGRSLSVAETGGHARLDACDLDGDGLRDLLVADGGGTLTVFWNKGRRMEPVLDAGRKVLAGGRPVHVGGRSSILACDWNGDGLPDAVLADDKGYWFLKNRGSARQPDFEVPKPILFGGRPAAYLRPNLGSFVDWDGDGKRDLIGCHFENSVRFYRNIGSGEPGTEPEFADPEGVVVLRASSPQMISGADVLDWNQDGDLDILTGQGHGGSGLRFFERDWIEDEIAGSHPVAAVGAFETRSRSGGR